MLLDVPQKTDFPQYPPTLSATPALVEPEASESTARAPQAVQGFTGGACVAPGLSRTLSFLIKFERSEDFEENEDENENKKSRPALLICMWRAWKYVSLS